MVLEAINLGHAKTYLRIDRETKKTKNDENVK